MMKEKQRCQYLFISDYRMTDTFFLGTFNGEELDTKLENEDKIIGWVHSHVRGVKCFFSSLDVHNQYIWQRLDPNHIGLVVQIHPDESLVDHDYYKLTSVGMKTVKNCLDGSLNQGLNINNSRPHSSCGRDNLYMSQKHLVDPIADLPLKINICQQIQAIKQKRILKDSPKQSIKSNTSERVLRSRKEIPKTKNQATKPDTKNSNQTKTHC